MKPIVLKLPADLFERYHYSDGPNQTAALTPKTTTTVRVLMGLSIVNAGRSRLPEAQVIDDACRYTLRRNHHEG